MPFNINELIICQNEPGALLIDVRTPQEYSEGHIPGSKNIPLQNIERITSLTDDKDTPLFVYCYSGARSQQAAIALKHMGFTSVKNLGGLNGYSGKVEL